MKKNTLIFTLLISLYCIDALSQKNKFDNSVCWEIKKTHTSTPSYILGSIHMMDTSQINFPINTFTHLLDKCKSLCLEISGENDSSQMTRLAKDIMLPDPKQNITTNLDKSYYDKLILIMDSSKTSLKTLKPILGIIRPSILSLFITMEKQSESVVYKNANFYPEKYFEDYSKLKNYEIYQLETLQQQLDWITMPNSTLDETLVVLKQTIDMFYSNDSIDMFLNYKNQNLKLLKPEVYSDSSMIDRNKGMADGIDNLLSKKTAFIIIGAAHLPYENGVLALLEKKGYIIKPYLVDLN